MTYRHALAVNPMLARVKKVEGRSGLGKEETHMIGGQRLAEIGEIDIEQFQQTAVGQLHGDDDVIGHGPDLIDANEVRVVELADGLQGANLLSGRGGAIAGQEFEGGKLAIGPRRAPDLAPAAAAQKLAELIAGHWLES